jgi:hypothetical protein
LSLRINAIVDDHIAVAVALVFAKLSNYSLIFNRALKGVELTYEQGRNLLYTINRY